MIRKGITVRDATYRWVSEFNAIQQGIIEKLISCDIDSWHEVTVPHTDSRVYIHCIPEQKTCGEPYYGTECCGRVTDVVGKDTYFVELDDGASVVVNLEDLEIDEYCNLPMWGTMWSFGNSCDDHWLEEDDGIKVMSECGFRIFEHDEYGYFFGIDGAGYDFFSEHFIPAYRKRGLQWHDPETEVYHEKSI